MRAGGAGADGYNSIPAAAVARLPVYRRVLLELLSTRTTTVSSTRLATLAGVNAAKVRKDLSYLGSFGIRGRGLQRRASALRGEQGTGGSPTTGPC